MPDPSPPAPKKPVKIAPPTGTRDFYPREMLVRRYITDAWRRTSLRHGFDEIDGPTFESAELYKVKSGEGILNEMFGVYSGKGLSEPEAQARGAFDPRNPPFGLRPEFTPTLARMYAARAKQLPQPTKWFCVSNFFRAERPQRGRLREFWQWNCDFIGGEEYRTKLDADIEIVAAVTALLTECGLTSHQCKVKLGDRQTIGELLLWAGVSEEVLDTAIRLLDRRSKSKVEAFADECMKIGLDIHKFDGERSRLEAAVRTMLGARVEPLVQASPASATVNMEVTDFLVDGIHRAGGGDWVDIDYSLARGLAYYTGTVFEVIAEGERAVAGGGRYDNLIELFGGPPTPACGFGMGDAVLGNLLEDRKLVPEGREMLEALARPMPYRPDVFVIASPNPGCEERIVPTVACLRRGEESEKYKQGECKPWSNERYSVPPLHARRSYKATKNVGKLLADAGACHARFAAIIESPEKCTLKNLDTGEQTPDVPLDQLAQRVAASA